jgi:oligopeptidase B
MECYFSSQRLPLLDRGIIYAIAHVRGGGEMGRQWYEEPSGGKFLCKKNTFDDFVDVAADLVEWGVTAPDRLSIEGASAGGLLIGASVNQRPDLFKAAIYGVPFVDVIGTMCDNTIPLVAAEWTEWGNPNEKRFFEYMRSYDPMSNVRVGAAYPSCLLVGGLHDPRVQYWEPTKLAATIRHGADLEKSGPICLKIETSAGHFSASDRYKYLREQAFDWAFLLDQVGLSECLKREI